MFLIGSRFRGKDVFYFYTLYAPQSTLERAEKYHEKEGTHMNKLFSLIFLMIFAVTATFAFAGGIPDDIDSSPQSGSVERSGDSGMTGSMELYNGQEAVLKLKADTEIGYSWELAGPYDKLVLEFESKESMMPLSEGVLGAEVWTFKALKPGKTKLTFKYVDPSGESAAGSMNAVFDVLVKEALPGVSGPIMGKQAPYYTAGTVMSLELSGVSRVNPLLSVKKDSGAILDFDVKPLCYVYHADGTHVSVSEIKAGDVVTVNYRYNEKKDTYEAVAIKIE